MEWNNNEYWKSNKMVSNGDWVDEVRERERETTTGTGTGTYTSNCSKQHIYLNWKQRIQVTCMFASVFIYM